MSNPSNATTKNTASRGIPTVFPPTKAKLETGVNDLLTLFPEIAAELRSANPSSLLASSVKAQEWECSLCGKTWSAAPKSRTVSLKPSVGCPDCSRKAALVTRGVKKLLKDEAPQLADEVKDASLLDSLTQSSHAQIEWICERGHVYTMSTNQRVYGRGCPVCAFRQLLIGYNDLASVRPDLVPEVVNTDDLKRLANDKVKIEWQHTAPDGKLHRWTTGVNERVYLDTGCSVCDGKTTQIGVNDFASVLKEKELDWADSNNFEPTEITWGSRKTVEVICNKHKEPNVMKTLALYISNGHTRCQDCISRGSRFRSKAETELCEFIAEHAPGLLVEENVRRFRRAGIFELDILVESKLAVDFNGTYWHQEGVFKPVGYHEKKREAVSRNGLVYFEVEEELWSKDKATVLTALLSVLKQTFGSAVS